MSYYACQIGSRVSYTRFTDGCPESCTESLLGHYCQCPGSGIIGQGVTGLEAACPVQLDTASSRCKWCAAHRGWNAWRAVLCWQTRWYTARSGWNSQALFLAGRPACCAVLADKVVQRSTTEVCWSPRTILRRGSYFCLPNGIQKSHSACQIGQPCPIDFVHGQGTPGGRQVAQ
jgi:hypothetical protein